MKKHIWGGLITGGVFGMVTAWIAMSSAWSAGGVVALAAMVDGVMAGLGIGWLIGATVAEGAYEEAAGDRPPLAQSRRLVTAH